MACVSSSLVAARFAFGALRDSHELAVRSLSESIHVSANGATIDEHALDEELQELAATTSVEAVVLVTADGQIVERLLGAGPGSLPSALPERVGPAWEIRGSGEQLRAIGRSTVGEGPRATSVIVRQRGAATAHEIERLRLATILAALPTLLLAAAASWLLSARAMRPAREAYEAQRTFLADASHELRTPVAALRAHVEVRLAATADDDPAKPSLVAMERQTEILGRLVDDLLVLARSEAAQGTDRSTEVSAEELLASVVADLEPLAVRHRITLRITRADEGVVRGDATALERMLVALVDNAIKHGGSGEVRVAVRREAREIVYSVEDDGPGIDAARLPRLFARFARGDTQAPGTGLGLPIAQGIARAHGGELSLEKAPGGGLLALIRLPGHA